MTDSENDSEKAKWKEKYRKSLDSIEELQKTTEILKKSIVRVSMAAEGDNSKLNSQLSDLRDLLRKDSSIIDIENKVESLSNTVRNLKDNKISRNPLFDNFSLLVQPLKKAPLSNDLTKRINTLSMQIKKSPENITAEELVNSYTAIIAEAIGISSNNISDIDYEIGSNKPSLLKKVFAKKIISNNSDDPNNMNLISDHIRDILLNLLDHLILPDTFQPKAKEIKISLKKGVAISMLPDTLNEIVSLVVDSASEETHDFEDFLQQIAEQLSELHKYLASIGVTSNDLSENSQNLGNNVKSQIELIKQNINKSQDIATLKENIQEQLYTIVDNVDDFCASQVEKQTETTAKINILKTRLTETEEESALLRERLVVQRAHAQLDPLTKLPNRQAYDHQLNSEFSRWQRYSKPLTLIIADIDFFKKINDTFGHAAGDKVLKTVARVLQVNLRETDFIARFGGEEFVILMPETSLDAAAIVADKLRTTINECPFHSSNQKVPVTLSFGVCEFNEGDSTEIVFNKADKALYKAKESGRNQVQKA